jgi:hypothetical protein
VTPETLRDALSLGMALRWHWQETRGETISDHEPFHIGFGATGSWSRIAATGSTC